MKKLINLLSLLLLATPSFAFAQFSRTEVLILNAGHLVNVLTGIIAGVALLIFFWGLTKYILKIGGDAKAAAEGKTLMIWGVVALFVMVSVWGLVRFIQHELIPGVDTTNPEVPGFNGRF